MLTPTLSFGGAQNIVVGLAEEVYSKGRSIGFISFCANNDYEERLNTINGKVVRLNYNKGFGFNHILSPCKFIKELCNKILSYRTDIIHINLFLNKLFLYNKKFSIP